MTEKNEVKEKARFCDKVDYFLGECDAGWMNCDSSGITSCRDEPKKDNCHYLVDAEHPRLIFAGWR